MSYQDLFNDGCNNTPQWSGGCRVNDCYGVHIPFSSVESIAPHTVTQALINDSSTNVLGVYTAQ